MEPLTIDLIVDAPPAEAVQRAYHFGVTPTEICDRPPDPLVKPAKQFCFVPDAWVTAA